MRRHTIGRGLRVDAHQKEKVNGGSMRKVSYCVNESGPLVMLQPHQHIARDLLRLVFMHKMSGIGDRHHRQVVDEIIQPIKILTDECLIVYPPDHQRRDVNGRISQPSLTQCPAAS